MATKKYNGWANYETWNVALWLQNDEGLYRFAQQHRTYPELADDLRECGLIETPDGVSYGDSGLNHRELNKMLAELAL